MSETIKAVRTSKSKLVMISAITTTAFLMSMFGLGTAMMFTHADKFPLGTQSNDGYGTYSTTEYSWNPFGVGIECVYYFITGQNWPMGIDAYD